MSTMTQLEKDLRAIRRKVQATHWIKGAYYRVFKRENSTTGKRCYCLAGLVNVQAGADPRMPQELTGHRLVDPTMPVYTWENAEVCSRARQMGVAILTAFHTTFPRRKPADTIEAFNDRAGTKREDVVAILDTAIERAKAEREAVA